MHAIIAQQVSLISFEEWAGAEWQAHSSDSEGNDVTKRQIVGQTQIESYVHIAMHRYTASSFSTYSTCSSAVNSAFLGPELLIEGLSNISQCIDRLCRVTSNHSDSRPQRHSLNCATTLSCGHLHFFEGSSGGESDSSPVCPSGGAGGTPQANSGQRAGHRDAAPGDPPPAGTFTARHGLRYQIRVYTSDIRYSRAVAGSRGCALERHLHEAVSN